MTTDTDQQQQQDAPPAAAPFDPATALPGHTLRRLNNAAKGVVEDALQRFQVARAIRSTVDLHASIRKQVIADTITDAAFTLAGDTPEFRRAVQSADGRLVTIVAAAGVGHGGPVNEDDVRAKVDALDVDTLGAVVAWCWGWEPAAA